MRQNRFIKIVITVFFILNNMAVIGQAELNKFEFASFETAITKENIVLNWTVTGEGISNYFEVERSFNGKNFKTIMYVLGPDPSTKEKDKFEGIYKITRNTKTYYRLKHINREGIVTFSPVKSPCFTL